MNIYGVSTDNKTGFVLALIFHSETAANNWFTVDREYEEIGRYTRKIMTEDEFATVYGEGGVTLVQDTEDLYETLPCRLPGYNC